MALHKERLTLNPGISASVNSVMIKSQDKIFNDQTNPSSAYALLWTPATCTCNPALVSCYHIGFWSLCTVSTNRSQVSRVQVPYASLDLTGLRFLTVFNKRLRWQWWPIILTQELSTNCMLSSVLGTGILKWRNYWIIQQIFILTMHSGTFRSLFLCLSESRGNIQRTQRKLNFGAKSKSILILKIQNLIQN